MAGANTNRNLSTEEIQNLLFNRSSSEESVLSTSDFSYVPNDSEDNDNSETSADEMDEDEMDEDEPPTSPDRQNAAATDPLPTIWKSDIELPVPFSFTGNPGIKCIIEEVSSILDYVKIFLTYNFINMIKVQTNNYALHLRLSLQRENRLKKNSLIATWTETSVDELYSYFAIVFLMGVIGKPTLQSYWSEIFFINTPVFSTIMSRTRYLQLRMCIHFSDNTVIQNDKLAKIKPVLDHFLNIFQKSYIPDSQLCIDEILQKWKGRLSWRQFIPSKRARYGIKLYLLCEVKTNYTWNLIIYTGKGTLFTLTDPIPGIDQQKLSHSTNIVICLAEKLLKQGYTITCDNWYGSPELCNVLNILGTDTYGTAKANRQNMPPDFRQLEPSKNNPIMFQKGNIFVMRWRDPYKKKKKIVTMISTIHDGQEGTSGKKTKEGEDVVKPIIILDYNKTMGAVDAVSQMTDPYKCARKGHKWYKKLFEYLMDIALLNAFILYKIKNPATKLTHKDFIIKTCELLIEAHSYGVKLRRRPSIESPNRLSARHFPNYLPSTNLKERPSRRCKVCSTRGIRRETRFQCLQCDGTALCVVKCFEDYHTKSNYSVSVSSDSSSD